MRIGVDISHASHYISLRGEVFATDMEHWGQEDMKDKELEAMGSVLSILEPLDGDARNRVLGWVVARLSIKMHPSQEVSRGEGASSTVFGAVGIDGYETFAEFHAAVGPKSQPEHALVAGYWAQKQGEHAQQEQFDSQAANKLLKNSGHGVGNIAYALSALMKRKPKLVIQVGKKSASKQARKFYKVTTSGIEKIQEMIGSRKEEK